MHAAEEATAHLFWGCPVTRELFHATGAHLLSLSAIIPQEEIKGCVAGCGTTESTSMSYSVAKVEGGLAAWFKRECADENVEPISEPQK